MTAPKMFISYSWSSPQHEEWVLNLATELVQNGVDVRLDKWHLQPGHDAYAFMESMVTDPTVTKVGMICDRMYAEKSDKRAGGAGAEAQIITPKLYKESVQDKFVAILPERDEKGNAFLPAYYASRIYIDLSDASVYASNFEKLLRWIFGKQVHTPPPIGQPPSFLSDDSDAGAATSVEFRRAIDFLNNSRPGAEARVNEYFERFASNLDSFRIATSGMPYDDVLQSIAGFLPIRNQFINFLSVLARNDTSESSGPLIHRFFEMCLPFTKAPAGVHSWNDQDFDNLKIILHELFTYTIAILIRHDRLVICDYLFSSQYFDRDDPRDPMKVFTHFRAYPQSLVERNRRSEQRRLSLFADVLRERNVGSGIDLSTLMSAEAVMFLRSISDRVWPWYPEFLLFASFHSRSFVLEPFARAQSSKYLARILSLINAANKEDLDTILRQTEGEAQHAMKWGYARLELRELTQFDALGTRR